MWFVLKIAYRSVQVQTIYCRTMTAIKHVKGLYRLHLTGNGCSTFVDQTYNWFFLLQMAHLTDIAVSSASYNRHRCAHGHGCFTEVLLELPLVDFKPVW